MTARTGNNDADHNESPVSTFPVATDNAGVVDLPLSKENTTTVAPSDVRPVLEEKQQPTVDTESNSTTATPCDKGELDKPCRDAVEDVESDSTSGNNEPKVEAAKSEPDDSAKSALMVKNMLEGQRRRVAEDLEKQFMSSYQIPDDLWKHLRPGSATEERINEFLKRCPLYDLDQQLWAGFVKRHQLEDGVDLDDIIFKIIEAVMADWGLSADGRRKIRRAHNLKLMHEEKDNPLPGYSSPTFVIEAKGPSFGLPSQDDLGFSNMTTCITTVRTREGVAVRGALKDAIELHATYARQIFIQQPNRQFVRTCFIDAMRATWFHFDRNGIYKGCCPLNGTYSGHPQEFVQLIVGICSLDEQVLGFDTSVQWKVDATGRKASGTLMTVDDESKISKTYQLLDIDPLSKNYSIYGTGSRTWAVRDPDNGQEVLVKDSWREESWYPEFEGLKAARNLDGLVQMISYEGTRAQTKDFGVSDYVPPEERTMHDPESSCENKILSRVVLEKYGPHLFCFRSEKQLLCAIRDAIAGHRNLLLEGGILQRDIAWRNILCGKPGASPGNRGILIDFDLAIPVSLIKPESSAWGHPQFMSIAILKNAHTNPWDKREYRLAHDHLDELESAFYTTASVMWELDKPGTRQDPCPEFVTEWLSSLKNLTKNLEFKLDFILGEEPVDPTEFIAPYWSNASRCLLEGFYMFTRHNARYKDEARETYGDIEDVPEEPMFSESVIREDYDYVLNLFDVAIKELDNATDEQKSDSTTQGMKRKADEVDEEPSTTEEAGEERVRRRKLD